jgi:xylulokinase
MHLLGYDIGSSSVKAALVDARSGAVTGVAHFPDTEMEIRSDRPGWAEQDPEVWWDCAARATRRLLEATGIAPSAIGGIGISYQMHGLVTVDARGEVLRPAIIWCDSRAVETGRKALEALGESYCLGSCLNGPGNFTAAKLAWVREHEPDLFARIHKILLPGDYIAYRMTGELRTTVTGLSEGIFFDFTTGGPARPVLDYFGLAESLLPEVTPVFSIQGRLHAEAARFLGLEAGIPLTYRAGDQPNNALALNVLRPGEVAATGGTSGVVYAVVDRPVADPRQRVNAFAHVNYSDRQPLTGLLLCINGAGSQYRWLRQMLGGDGLRYEDMERMAASVPPGADGLLVLPFGNGAERMLENRQPGARILDLDFNRHGRAHLCRAALEGIAFAFAYGIDVLRALGLPLQVLRAGGDNLFRSAVFSQTLSMLVGCRIEVVDTTGAVGAARAAGVGAGFFGSIEEAMGELEVVAEYGPEGDKEGLKEAFERWKQTPPLTPPPMGRGTPSR